MTLETELESELRNRGADIVSFINLSQVSHFHNQKTVSFLPQTIMKAPVAHPCPIKPLLDWQDWVGLASTTSW